MIDLKLLEQSIIDFSNLKQEPEWFQQLRRDAFVKKTLLVLPSFEKIRYQKWPIIPEKLIKESEEFVSKKSDENTFIQVGSRTVSLNISEELKEKHVIICDWSTALVEHADLIKKYFMTKAVKWDSDLLTATHLAQLTGGLFIYVPKNVVLDNPITTYLTQDAWDNQDYVQHVLIVAAENSQFSYLENRSTVGDQTTTANIIVEVIAEANSHVKFAGVDQLGENTTAYINRRGYLLDNAKIDWSIGLLNDGNIIGDFDSDLIGAGSHADVKVVAISTGNQIQGIDTRVTNYGKHSIGQILQHGVILSRSTLTFNGIGHIIKGAKGANAQQESRVLMLSTKARGDANPILLIDENDVQAGHAASVGRVNQEQLYYLMSRGLHKEEAERLVIRGFLGPVLTAIPAVDVRERLIETIEGKLINGQKFEKVSQ
ncbi:Fe-S cluster assembly protein SufD [Dellaglioa sp. P0083]|uniref:Fe-S cluster assembly protein SufD n=1 Tax=Dellaglioa kimchii TaxID=3344667 RepID=UPI0038D3A32A